MKFIRRSLVVLGLSLFAISSGLAQETCKRDVEPGFSLCVPEGYYLEAGENHKLVVTGTCLVKDKDTFDSVFERAAKSLRLDN